MAVRYLVQSNNVSSEILLHPEILSGVATEDDIIEKGSKTEEEYLKRKMEEERQRRRGKYEFFN